MAVLPRMLYRILRGWLWLARPVTVGVRVALMQEGCVLLVRHTYQDGWLLPGGGVKKGETLEAAARREAMEEVGAQMGRLRLQGVYTNFHEHKSDHVAVFTCEDFSLAPGKGDRLEIAASGFFPLDALPEDLFVGHRRRLEEIQHGAHGPGFGPW